MDHSVRLYLKVVNIFSQRTKNVIMLLLNLQFALSKSRKKVEKNFKGAHGFEPWTYRTAADCSTTELYPLTYEKASSVANSCSAHEKSRHVKMHSRQGCFAAATAKATEVLLL